MTTPTQGAEDLPPLPRGHGHDADIFYAEEMRAYVRAERAALAARILALPIPELRLISGDGRVLVDSYITTDMARSLLQAAAEIVKGDQ